MKLKKTSKIGVALLVGIALSAVAHAASIQGVISFGGGVILDSTDVGTATKVNAWVSPTVGIATSGDFAPLIGQSVAFTNGWTFNSAGLDPLWSVGGFSFKLLSSAIPAGGQDSTGILVLGIGILTKAGFDPTPGTWRFTTQEPGAGPLFQFSAAGRTIPDGGSSVALLGASLLGIGAVRRKLMK